jgi:prepilin-type N-terminal cleavage/methylation domain-containing protein
MRKKQQGFSLLELLIVIVIGGILAAIAIPNLVISRIAANEASALADTRALHQANYAFFSVNDFFTITKSLQSEKYIDGFLNNIILPCTVNTSIETSVKAGYGFSVVPIKIRNLTPERIDQILSKYGALPLEEFYLITTPRQVFTGSLIKTGRRIFYIDSNKNTLLVISKSVAQEIKSCNEIGTSPCFDFNTGKPKPDCEAAQ